MLFSKKESNESILKYNDFLAKENRKLNERIEFLEKQLEIAHRNEKNAENLLDRYKGEYEQLIKESKQLISKQKNADKELNNITESYKKKLDQLVNK